MHVKQYHTVTCLGCAKDEDLSRVSIVLRVIKKINTRLRSVPRLLYNAIIQLHFHYACPAWYPNLNIVRSLKIKGTNTPGQMSTLLFEFE